MKKYKKIFIWLAVIILVLIVVPFFIPMRAYLDQAEQIASEKLGQPVSISTGRLVLLPAPQVLVKDITVGHQQEIKLETLSVIPVLSSLLQDTKVIHIELTRPVVKKAAIDIFTALTVKDSEPDASAVVAVEHITINELQLDWPEMKLPALNLDVALTDANALKAMMLESVDGALNANVTPEVNGYAILVHAKKWILPAKLPLLINQAVLEMHLQRRQLNIPRIDIALYNGTLKGHADLSWAKNWHASGKLQVRNLAVKEPSRMLSQSVYLSGDLSGNGKFSAFAKEASGLADNIDADFAFNVNQGVLHGLDLVKLASLLIDQGSGGETRFDEFSAILGVKGKQYALRDIKIRSGLLAASGQVKVKADKTLDGIVNVELKKGVSLANVPLQVSGTVDKPSVLPTKAAMAGAVAGTAILGPGVGTSLGVAAGGAVDKINGLFQSD